jgi:hypothetical protein
VLERSRPHLRVAVFAACGILLSTLVATPAHADEARWPTVRVLIESPVPATLEREGSGPVCSSPCDVDVPLDGSYRIRIAGDSAPTQPFQLHALPGWSRVTLKIDPASPAVHRTGTVIAVVGIVAVVGGLALMGSSGSSSSFGRGLGFLLAGGLTAGVGIFTVAVGLAVAAAGNADPTVTQSAASELGRRRIAAAEPDVLPRATSPAFAIVPSLRFSF